MKHKLRTALTVVLALVLIYGAGILFFGSRLALNTTVAQVNVGGLTVQQAAAKVQKTLNDQTVEIKEGGKAIATVKVGELAGKYDLEKTLQHTLKGQQAMKWASYLFQPTKVSAVNHETLILDDAKLKEILATQGVDNSNRTAATDAKITYSETDGFQVQQAVTGTQIDYAVLAQQIANELGQSKQAVELDGNYQSATVTEDSDAIVSKMAKIDRVAGNKLVYEIAEEEVEIPRKTIEHWLYFDEDEDVIVDETLVREYLEELNAKYNTFDKVRQFQSTLQGEVSVQPGILGWGIDVEAEIPALIASVQAGTDMKREPAIYGVGTRLNKKDDIGPTYIEVDIRNQTMFLYVNKELVLSTPVVTGQPAAPTQPGANAIIEMLRDTPLKGYNPIKKVEYSVPVQYWMRFDYNAQGIHDASWQSSFGGDTLTWSGSLGCVNTPIDAMTTIFEMVDYGTPVIVFE